MSEEWVDLYDNGENLGYRYQVSNLGRVRSLDMKLRGKSNSTYVRRGKVLTPVKQKSGYWVVGISIDGKLRQRLVSRLVAYSFHGKPPEGYEACHNDGDKDNNSLENIRWDSKVGNAADKSIHGNNNEGESNPNSRLSERVVSKIISMSKSGVKNKDISLQLDVPETTISHILCGVTWSSVTGLQYSPKHKSVSDTDKVRFCALKHLGLSLDAIAEVTGFSKPTVFRHARKSILIRKANGVSEVIVN